MGGKQKHEEMPQQRRSIIFSYIYAHRARLPASINPLANGRVFLFPFRFVCSLKKERKESAPFCRYR